MAASAIVEEHERDSEFPFLEWRDEGRGCLGLTLGLGLLVFVECDRLCYSKCHLNSMSDFSRICYGAWTSFMVEFSVIFLLFFLFELFRIMVSFLFRYNQIMITNVGKVESPSRPHCLA